MKQKVTFLSDGKVVIENSDNRHISTFKRNFQAQGPRPVAGHKYDREGEAYFWLTLDEDVAEEMIKDGWQVNSYESHSKNDPDDVHTVYEIRCVFDTKFNPNSEVVHMSDPDENGKRRATHIKLGSGAFKDLDSAAFDTVDVTLKPTRKYKQVYIYNMIYSLEQSYLSDKWGSFSEDDFGSPADEEEVPFE